MASQTIGLDGNPYLTGVNLTLCAPTAASQTLSKPVCRSNKALELKAPNAIDSLAQAPKVKLVC